MDSLVLFYPEGHQAHYIYGHPENPERVERIREGLEQAGFWNKSKILPPLEVREEILLAVHDPQYLKLLKRASLKEEKLDLDTYATRSSWQLALNAAGGALAVASQVWEEKARTGFALTRPPGHHATRNRAMGFCLINNVAVAAEYLLREKGARKIAILDLDLHHGNGTQDIFWDRNDVIYISIHQAPFYPGTGALYEIGGGDGEGATLNLPIPAFSGDLAYRSLLAQIILPYLEVQKPDFLLISFGFDNHWKDPLGSLQVSAGCIYGMIEDICSWADENCAGKVAVVLEGGYDLDAAQACGQAVAAALSKEPWEDYLGKAPVEEHEDWRETLREAKGLFGF